MSRSPQLLAALALAAAGIDPPTALSATPSPKYKPAKDKDYKSAGQREKDRQSKRRIPGCRWTLSQYQAILDADEAYWDDYDDTHGWGYDSDREDFHADG